MTSHFVRPLTSSSEMAHSHGVSSFSLLPAQASSTTSSTSGPSRPCASLTDICLQHYRSHLEEIGNLQHLPEPLVQQLLYMVFIDGALTPSLVKLFDSSGHESIQKWIASNIHLDRAMMINSTANCRAGRY